MSFRTRITLAAAALAVTGGVLPAVASAAGPLDDHTAEAKVAAPPYAASRVLVKYAPGVDLASQQGLEHAGGASRVGAIDSLGVTMLHVPAGAEQRVVDALSRSGKAMYAERDGLGRPTGAPSDPVWPQQSTNAKVNGPAAWDL